MFHLEVSSERQMLSGIFALALSTFRFSFVITLPKFTGKKKRVKTLSLMNLLSFHSKALPSHGLGSNFGQHSFLFMPCYLPLGLKRAGLIPPPSEPSG